MATQPPPSASAEDSSASADDSAPIFEHSAQATHGSLRIQRFRRHAPPACFGELAPMVAVWQGKCRGEALPRWKDFAIEDFVGWHRYVALSDLAPDADPRFRIFGSGVTEILGGDLTGKRLSQGFPAAAQDGVLAHFAAVRDQRVIGLLTSNVAKAGHEHRRITVVELPLQNDSGEVSQILHVCRNAPRGG